MNPFKIKQFLILLLSLFILYGCSDSTSSSTNEYTTLTNYMAENNLDLTDVLTDWIIPASSVNGNTGDYYIIDLRSSTDYAAGHINGAVNSTLADILTTAANAGTKTILIVCYTGQTAAHGLVALRLSGYTNSKILKWGMSGWNAAFDKWTANCTSDAVGNPNWKTTPDLATNTEKEPPIINTGKDTGAEILAARVQSMLAGGFKGVSHTDVLTTPSNYFINNYWDLASVNTYGHIAGAHRILEDLNLQDNGFKYLDSDNTIVTYCWTGQTSSVVTAYLNVLGYNAVSLKFGANGMIYNNLQVHKWAGSADYPYVTN